MRSSVRDDAPAHAALDDEGVDAAAVRLSRQRCVGGADDVDAGGVGRDSLYVMGISPMKKFRPSFNVTVSPWAVVLPSLAR